LHLLLLGACATTPGPRTEDVAALHKRLLVLDTHLDTPLHFGRPGWSFGDKHDPATDIAQVDMGRMEEGALDGGFFVIYTDQGPLTAKGYADALAFARGRSDAIDTTIAQFPERIAPALTAQDARRLNGENRLIAFKSIENSYPLGEDLTLLAEFHKRGVRMAGPVHGKNNQFADSSTDTPRWNGLSPLGRQWVAEMNRLGMVIDASHASDAVFDQLLELSRAPIILSHTTGRHAYDHPRNLDDARIREARGERRGDVHQHDLPVRPQSGRRARRTVRKVRADRDAAPRGAGRAGQALARTRQDPAAVGRRFRNVHRDGAARREGRRTRPCLLQRGLGRRRRGQGVRGYLGAAPGHRAA
jgi:microsomal dipeptidase-like Zn-dependent dipeptidase